jgi:hypothetical protein
LGGYFEFDATPPGVVEVCILRDKQRMIQGGSGGKIYQKEGGRNWADKYEYTIQALVFTW